MPYAALMPSIEAIKQACREDLTGAPREHQAFAVYIFERAREIDHQKALAAKISQQAAASHPRPTSDSASSPPH